MNFHNQILTNAMTGGQFDIKALKHAIHLWSSVVYYCRLIHLKKTNYLSSWTNFTTIEKEESNFNLLRFLFKVDPSQYRPCKFVAKYNVQTYKVRNKVLIFVTIRLFTIVTTSPQTIWLHVQCNSGSYPFILTDTNNNSTQ